MSEGDAIIDAHPTLRTQLQREPFLSAYFDFLWDHRVLLCHIACDLAVLATPETGGRVVGHVGAVVTALSGGSTSDTARTRAKAALGALQGPITLSEPDTNPTATRTIAVAAALAVLNPG
jgi:hypothetical protein